MLGTALAKAQSIIRRYEFYSFTGLYNAESHEAQFCNGFGDSNPGPSDVGNFIGAQNAALNFVIPGSGVGGVPEPTSWAMLLLGFGAIGSMARGRRNRPVPPSCHSISRGRVRSLGDEFGRQASVSFVWYGTSSRSLNRTTFRPSHDGPPPMRTAHRPTDQ